MGNKRHEAVTDSAVTVRVRVQPRGSRSEIQGFVNGLLRIKTTAAPADGKANADVIKQLAKAYKVPASSVRLVRGSSSREKVFRIIAPGMTPVFPVLDRKPAENGRS